MHTISIYPLISIFFISNRHIPLISKLYHHISIYFHSSSACIFFNCMSSLSISNRYPSLSIMQSKMLSCSQLRMLISNLQLVSLFPSSPSLSLSHNLISLCQIVSPISMNSRLEVAFRDTQQQLMLIIMFQIKDYTNQPLGVTNDQTRNSTSAREGAETKRERETEGERGMGRQNDLHDSRVCCPFLGLSTR